MLDMQNNMKPTSRLLPNEKDISFNQSHNLSLASKDLFKFIMDYTLAAIGLLIFLPASALIALAIKLSCRGSVLVRQECLGRDNRVFEVLKFRTITIDWKADARNGVCEGQKRATHIGRFLKRSGLDELPNLINVLRGEMSIVGPRPHALIHSAHHGPAGLYAARHRVKPGITGWAQIHGYAGEAEGPQLMAEQLRHDLEYVACRSPWLDLKIIALSLPYSLFRKRR